MNKKKYRIGKIQEYILILVVLICSGYYYNSVNSNLKISVCSIGIIYIYKLIKNFEILKIRKVIFFLLIIIFGICLTFFISGDSNYNIYLNLIGFVISGYMISILIPFDDFIKKYQRLLTIFVIISLIGYFLNQLSLLNFLPTIRNNNGIYYKSGIIFTWILGIENRNCGIFWEPGLFATAIIWGILFEVVFLEKIHKKRITLYYLALLTINSSAGYLLGGISLFLILLDKKQDKTINIINQGIILIIIAIILKFWDDFLFFLGAGNNEFLKKLLKENIINSTRFQVITYNFLSYLEAPLFGNGFGKVYSIQLDSFDVNTSLNMMSLFGFTGIIYNLMFIRGVFKIKFKSNLYKFIMLIIIFSILNKEPHQEILFTWVILFYLNSLNIKKSF